MHRSGTTLLAKILASHPEVAGLVDSGATEDEGQHLQTVYPPEQAHGGPGRFAFCEAAHLTETSALVTPHARTQLLSEWGRYWDMNKSVLVEKSPPNLTKTRFLQALFPEAHFVVVLRHPIAVASATNKWAPRWMRPLRLHRLIQHWLRGHEIFTADSPHIKRVIMVRYEDLVHAPDAQLDRIWRFLDLPASSVEAHILPSINSRYFADWRGAWWNMPKAGYRWMLIRAFEARIGAFGYSLKVPEASVSPAPQIRTLLSLP